MDTEPTAALPPPPDLLTRAEAEELVRRVAVTVCDFVAERTDLRLAYLTLPTTGQAH